MLLSLGTGCNIAYRSILKSCIEEEEIDVSWVFLNTLRLNGIGIDIYSESKKKATIGLFGRVGCCYCLRHISVGWKSSVVLPIIHTRS